MTRSLIASCLILVACVSSARSQTKPPAASSEKPVITVVLPNTDAMFEDLKLLFDLAGDSKGYKTLKETMEVFLDGVETDKPGGIRLYSNGNDLQYVVTLPVKNQAEFKRLLMNLWDLDVKTAPPPTPALLPQVPAATRTKLPSLKLAAASERLMFNLFDGFLRYEQAAGQVHIGTLLADVRNAKGALPAELLKGADLLARIDGTAHTPEARRGSFAKARSEVLGALKKGEKEDESAFALRKALTEHQVDEIERFFADSSSIDIGWTTSSKTKDAKITIDLAAVAGTTLEQSIELLAQVPDEFAAVKAEGAVLKLAINFPLDALRQQHLQNVSKLARDSLKVRIGAGEAATDDQKNTDKDLVDLVFDVVDQIGTTGLFNGFIRSWSNGDGTITSIGATKVPNGANFVNILQKFAARGEAARIELKAETEADVEIHKLTVPDLGKEYPELIAKDGTIYVGTSTNAVWYATGDKSLDRLKRAIQEAKAAGPQPGPTIDFKAQLLSWVEVLDSVRNRQQPVKPVANKPIIKQTSKTDDKKKPLADKAVRGEQAKSLLAELQLRRLALEAFRQGQDTLSMSLARDDKTVKVVVQFDEGLLRFVGKALAKFVKDNLGED
jgi:hypothetical protein